MPNLLRPTQEQISAAFLDITAPEHVQVQINRQGTIVWVNVEGVCAFRACRVPTLELDDQRITDIFVLYAYRVWSDGQRFDFSAPFTTMEHLNTFLSINPDVIKKEICTFELNPQSAMLGESTPTVPAELSDPDTAIPFLKDTLRLAHALIAQFDSEHGEGNAETHQCLAQLEQLIHHY